MLYHVCLAGALDNLAYVYLTYRHGMRAILPISLDAQIYLLSRLTKASQSQLVPRVIALIKLLLGILR